jgi:hypothetical protein
LGKSFKISLRFNPEYDQEVIKKIESIKGDRNLSRILRKVIRDGLSIIEIKQSDALSDKKDHTLSDNKNETRQDKLNENIKIETEKNKNTKDPVKWNWPK